MYNTSNIRPNVFDVLYIEFSTYCIFRDRCMRPFGHSVKLTFVDFEDFCFGRRPVFHFLVFHRIDLCNEKNFESYERKSQSKKKIVSHPFLQSLMVG